ncbi:hypothetical protein NUW54_g348 [Trametes sanguinea]|uniref:Uncharacterized protein n=1 Tax=Trametes sanguinea TaxID=158606 RepID=A0ACC1QB58_9APHY|nr:hypothetical protein NUW54_g348 [Trametes sanguinea]
MLQPYTSLPECPESPADSDAYSFLSVASARPTGYATLEDALIDMEAQLQENENALLYNIEHTLNRHLPDGPRLDLPPGAAERLVSGEVTPRTGDVLEQDDGQGSEVHLAPSPSSMDSPGTSSGNIDSSNLGQPLATPAPTTPSIGSRDSSSEEEETHSSEEETSSSEEETSSSDEETFSSEDSDEYEPAPSVSMKRKKGKTPRRRAAKRAKLVPRAAKTTVQTRSQGGAQVAASDSDHSDEEESQDSAEDGDEENHNAGATFRMTHNIDWTRPPMWGDDIIPEMPAERIFKYLKATYSLQGQVTCQYNDCGKKVDATATLKKHLECNSHIRLRKQCTKCNWDTRADMWNARAPNHPCEDSR